jgi:hypothetical protein
MIILKGKLKITKIHSITGGEYLQLGIYDKDLKALFVFDIELKDFIDCIVDQKYVPCIY